MLLFVFGLPCGLLTGLTGIGNSIVLLPLLRFLVGLLGPRASGTALAVTFFAALTGMLSYGQNHQIRWGLGVVLAMGQLVGAVLGQRLALRTPSLARLGVLWAVLVVALGLAMTANALGIVAGGRLPVRELPALLLWPTALLVAVAVGVVSRVIELGGVFLVPAAVYGLGLTPHVAQGTALLVLVLASLPGMLIHARRGDVEPQSATWMSLGGVFGALVGAFYATAVLRPEKVLLLIYGVLLTLIGVSLLWRRDSAAPPATGAGTPEGPAI